MGEEIPQRIKGLYTVITLLLLLIPYMVGSSISCREEVGELIDQPTRPLSIDQLITHHSTKYGVDEKLARDIIYCESRFYPDALNKKALVGEDVGLFQLNSHYWQETMALNGWDIYNTEDNIEAGIWLLSIEGSRPWYPSEHCWSCR